MVFKDEVAGIRIQIKPMFGCSNFEMMVSCDRFTCSLEGGKDIARLDPATQPMKMTFYRGGLSLGLELRRGQALGQLIMMVRR